MRADIADDKRAALDSSLCLSLKTGVRADTVLLFCPVRNEPNILPFAEYLLRSGVRVAFPISLKDTCELDFRYVDGLDSLVTGAYSIPEPPKDSPRVTDLSRAICIVPALAFDKRGFRIGYGKGYYDRFLTKTGIRSVGVAYSSFLVDTLPTDKNDVAVDTIITERGVELTNG